MKLDCKRNQLFIIPECEEDAAYLEDTIGLHVDNVNTVISYVDICGTHIVGLQKAEVITTIQKIGFTK